MMRKNYFIFAGVSSMECRTLLCQVNNEIAPKREMSFQGIPGRPGDIIIDQDRWSNVKVKYTCAIIDNFQIHYNALKNSLYRHRGYQRLEDTIHPGEFRMAVFSEPIEPKTARYNNVGQFELIFNCKPQRFLKSGEHEILFDGEGMLFNATSFPAKPLITVYGTGAGTVNIGDFAVEVKELDEPLILDCDNQNAYSIGGAETVINKNAKIFAPQFPELKPGENRVRWSGDVTGLQIIPRWWII